MEEMYPHDVAPPLTAVLGASRSFGLTEVEAWQCVGDALASADLDASVSDSMDEITALLAQRIMSKQRRVIAERRPPGHDEL